jgi:hypothetical protein
VRQREEDDVVASEILGRGLDKVQMCERAQLWLECDEGSAGALVRRYGSHLEVGMLSKNAEQLTTRVAACARNCH